MNEACRVGFPLCRTRGEGRGMEFYTRPGGSQQLFWGSRRRTFLSYLTSPCMATLLSEARTSTSEIPLVFVQNLLEL